MNPSKKQCTLPLSLVEGIRSMHAEDPVVRAFGEQTMLGLARQRQPEALVVLADGCLEDQPKRATRYYRRAAEMGYTTAMLRLGAYFETRGDNRVARKWFNQAAIAGDRQARQWLTRLRLPLPLPPKPVAPSLL